MPRFDPLRCAFLTIITLFLANAATAQQTISIPNWTGSFNFNGQNFTFTMIGTNPFDPTQGPKTKVPVVIIPLKFKLLQCDPTQPNCSGATTTYNANGFTCTNTQSALTLTLNSPLFQDTFAFNSPNNTYTGAGQYTDAFQRANFLNGQNFIPTYHVLLRPVTTGNVVTVTPLWSQGMGALTACSHGNVDQAYFDSLVPGILSGQAIPPTTLAVFLSYNVTFDGGGYHGIVPVNGVNQTYVVASFNDDPQLSFQPDVDPLSHELAEWMDNPLHGRDIVNFPGNQVPGWVPPGTQGCRHDLEVGDAVIGTGMGGATPMMMVPLNGFNYHVQDEAFLYWFTQQPSSAIDGLYSFLGTFMTPAQNCP